MTTTTERPQPPVSDDRTLGRIEATLESMKENMATKADLEKLRTEMAKNEARALRWQLGMWIATIMLLLGLFGLILSNGGG